MDTILSLQVSYKSNLKSNGQDLCHSKFLSSVVRLRTESNVPSDFTEEHRSMHQSEESVRDQSNPWIAAGAGHPNHAHLHPNLMHFPGSDEHHVGISLAHAIHECPERLKQTVGSYGCIRRTQDILQMPHHRNEIRLCEVCRNIVKLHVDANSQAEYFAHTIIYCIGIDINIATSSNSPLHGSPFRPYINAYERCKCWCQ